MYIDWQENLIEDRVDEEQAFIEYIKVYEPMNSSGANVDFAIVNGEPFAYDDAVLDSIASFDINSIDADENYRELVIIDRLVAEAQRKLEKNSRKSYMQSLIDEHLEEEKSLFDCFEYEIQLQNDYETFLEHVDEDPKPHYWDDDFPESWCDEYAAESDPFDSLDYSPYDDY